MVNDAGSTEDGRYHVSTPGILSIPSSVATESTVLSPRAKQTYFKEHKVQIPDIEKVCTVKHNLFLGVTQIMNISGVTVHFANSSW